MAKPIEIGRLCIKLAGRDAGRECLIIDDLGNGFVLIDGNTRRRKCNIKHLELLPQVAKIKKGASHEEVINALIELGIKVREKPKKKKETEKKKLINKLKSEKKEPNSQKKTKSTKK